MINEYLDEVFPAVPLRPADPVERARMRSSASSLTSISARRSACGAGTSWCAGSRSGSPRTSSSRSSAGFPLKEQRDKWATVAGESFTPAQLEDSKRKIAVSIERLETILDQSPWIAGGSYSLADINAYPMVSGVRRIFPDILNEKLAPRSWTGSRGSRRGPATQAALAMPNKVPELLRTFSD